MNDIPVVARFIGRSVIDVPGAPPLDGASPARGVDAFADKRRTIVRRCSTEAMLSFCLSKKKVWRKKKTPPVACDQGEGAEEMVEGRQPGNRARFFEGACGAKPKLRAWPSGRDSVYVGFANVARLCTIPAGAGIGSDNPRRRDPQKNVLEPPQGAQGNSTSKPKKIGKADL
jgi:hypothetical protein